jgi:hypothetical protein
VSCSWVCLYRLFSTTSGTSLRLSSITTRMPDLSDSSRMSEMPSTSSRSPARRCARAASACSPGTAARRR